MKITAVVLAIMATTVAALAQVGPWLTELVNSYGV
jgi:hypothetical protein